MISRRRDAGSQTDSNRLTPCLVPIAGWNRTSHDGALSARDAPVTLDPDHRFVESSVKTSDCWNRMASDVELIAVGSTVPSI
jgi:hypothetical protein